MAFWRDWCLLPLVSLHGDIFDLKTVLYHTRLPKDDTLVISVPASDDDLDITRITCSGRS